MDSKELKQLIKKEIAPILIGIRNDLDEKTNRPLIDKVEGVLLRGKKGKDGYTPVADKDYPSEKTVFQFIKDNLPKKGKDYFTDSDIKDIVSDVFKLIPSKEELKGEKGDNARVDYSIVESLASPLIENKYDQIKKYIDEITDRTIKAIEDSKIPELTPEKIRNKLESLKGNARLDAKSIKGLEKYMSSFISTSTGGGGGPSRLSQLSDVNVAGVTTDQSIKWNGTSWIPYTPTDLDEQTLQSVTSFGATTTIQSTFSGGIITPLIIGGTGTTSDLILQTTSGVGATGADIIFRGGNNGGTEFGRFFNSGNLSIGSSTEGAKLDILSTVAGTKGLVVQGHASQTASLAEFNFDATTYARFNATGGLYIRDEDTVGGVGKVLLTLDGPYGSTQFYGSFFNIANINLNNAQTLYIGRGGGGLGVGGYLGGITSKFAVNGNAVIGNGYTLLSAPTNGMLVEGDMGIGTGVTVGAKLQINSSATSKIGQIIRGFSGQTANLSEWQTSGGTVIDRVDYDGYIHRGDTIEWSETKALTAGAGGYIELGTMLGASISSSSTIEIYLQWYTGGNAQSRKYIVCGAYNALGGAWLRVEPYSEYNGYANAIELDAINAGANTKFRIIAPSITKRPSSVFVTYKITNPYLRTSTRGLSSVWTTSSTTGTDTSSLNPYPYTVIRQRNSELQIANINSSAGYSRVVPKESQTNEMGAGTKGLKLYNTGRVTADGSFGNAGGEFYGMTVSVPNATNDYCEFATISTGSFTAGVEIWTSVRQGGYAVSKRYMIQMDYGATGGAWHKLMPIASSGPYSGNDQDLEISITAGIATIRVRRVSGATTNATMYVGILIGAIETSVSVTQTNVTGTTTAPTVSFQPTAISQINGRVGIGSLTGDNPNSTLDLKGSLALPYVEKTSTYTISATDYTVNCTSGTFTVNLPTAVGIDGRTYVVKNSGAGTITLDGDGTETIDGLTTQSITTGLVMKVQSTGSNWIII
jgi:hypothetical protein